MKRRARNIAAVSVALAFASLGACTSVHSAATYDRDAETEASADGPNTGSSGGDSGADSSVCQEDAAPRIPSCDQYCARLKAVCTGRDLQFAEATYDADCAKACSLIPPDSDARTSTLLCRKEALDVLEKRQAKCPGYDTYITDDGAPYDAEYIIGGECAAAGMLGSICGDECDTFCQIAIGLCPTAYSDPVTCRTACLGWKSDASGVVGVFAPSSGNTFNCRTHYLYSALSDPTACANIADSSPACQ